MGGKSRKSGGVSKKLIQALKAGTHVVNKSNCGKPSINKDESKKHTGFFDRS